MMRLAWSFCLGRLAKGCTILADVFLRLAERGVPITVRPLHALVDAARPEGWQQRATVCGIPLADLNEDELRALAYDLGGLVEQQALREVAAAAQAPPGRDPEPLGAKMARAANAWRN